MGSVVFTFTLKLKKIWTYLNTPGHLFLPGNACLSIAQSLPAGRGGGRGLDISVGEARRQRRDVRNLVPYEDQMMSYPATQGGGRANDLYYQTDDWRGRGLDQALQRLVERDQRREQEEEQRAGWRDLICLHTNNPVWHFLNKNTYISSRHYYKTFFSCEC